MFTRKHLVGVSGFLVNIAKFLRTPILKNIYKRLLLTLFRMERGKRPPTSFSPVASTNVGISPKNFLTFSVNPFANLVQNFKAIPSVSFKLLNLNQEDPSKNCFSGQIFVKLRL